MILSIIVPTYNVEDYLSNCLDSLINQDIAPEDYEIIVINDGSSDSSPEIAASYEESLDHLKVIHQKNQGLSGARNKGLELALGKYVLFVDSDDYLARDTLGHIVSLMKKNDLDVLGIGYRHTEELDLTEAVNSKIKYSEELRISDGITYVADHAYYTSACFYMIKKEYLLDIGLTFPLGRYHEDTNFVASLLTHSKRIGNSSLDVYRYVSRSGSITNKRTKKHLLELVDSSVKNLEDLNPLLEWVNNSVHENASACYERLKGIQQYWVFLLIIVIMRARMNKGEVAPILDKLALIGAYPIDKVFLKYHNNMSYSLLRFVMNRKLLLYTVLNVLSKLDRSIPDFQTKVDTLTRALSKIRT